MTGPYGENETTMTDEQMTLLPESAASFSPDEVQDLLHELQVHQVELEGEEEEVLEAAVEVGHGPRPLHVPHVRQVDVAVDPEQARKDLGHQLAEVTGEGGLCRCTRMAHGAEGVSEGN